MIIPMDRAFPARICFAILLLFIALGAVALMPSSSLAQNTAPPARFSAEVSGEGPDAIFIPGLSTTREAWRGSTDDLEGNRIHLLQIRGFGEEAGVNSEGPVLEPLIAELARYIEDNDLDRPAIVGHSLGGFIAMKLAAEHPDLVGRVMIVDSLPWFAVITVPPGTEPDMAQVTMRAEGARAMMLRMPGNQMPQGANDALLSSYIVDQSKLPLLREWTGSADLRVTGQLVYELMTGDMREGVAGITAPVTIVYPHQPGFMTPQRVESFYRQQYANLPHAEFVAIAPAAHFLMVDQPEAFRTALEAFLER